MMLTVRVPAPSNSVFPRDAFERRIGTDMPVPTGDGPKMYPLLSAVVSEDGRYVEMTVEIPDPPHQA